MESTSASPTNIILKSGEKALLRPLFPSDRELLQTGWAKLSAETIRKRFLAAKKGFSATELDHLVQVDHINHCAYGVALMGEEGLTGIGIGRFVREPEFSNSAEFAIVIVDEYQHLGVGTLLMAELIYQARKRGIKVLNGKMDATNLAMRNLLQKWPFFSYAPDSPGVVSVVGNLDQAATGHPL